MQGTLVQVPLVRQLDNLAQIHYRDPVADMVDDAEIVGDEQIAQMQPRLQLLEQIEHLSLDRNVERGNRFVTNDQRRIQNNRPRYAYPLALTAGKLVRIAGNVAGRQTGELKMLHVVAGIA